MKKLRINRINAARVLSLGALILLGGCATAPTIPAGMEACGEPRPQICTAIYAPVCAVYEDGSRKTAGSACSACGDPEIIGSTPGECEEQ